MEGRLKQLVKRCKNRGGDCECRFNNCEALQCLTSRRQQLDNQIRQLSEQISELDMHANRLTSPPATLRNDFQFREGLEPVMVFEGFGEACFGYEDEDGEWIEANTWPFNESFVWWDDCERFGIRVE